MTSVDLLCSEHSAAIPPTQAKTLRFDVPILTNRREDVPELDALLLAWTLLLYRHNSGNHVQYSWSLSEIGASPNGSFELNTSKLPWEATDSVSTALDGIRGYLRQTLNSDTPVAAERFTLFFNDESAPDGSSSYVQEGDYSMGWGNIQLQAVIANGSLWLRPCWREPVGAEFLANHFAHSLVEILNTTLSDKTSLIGSVLELGDLDSSVIWGWNKDVPPATEVPIHQLIRDQVQRQPEAPAICSWDGDLTYAEVDQYSTLIAHHLISLGLQVGQIVPLCFEKSRWTIVAIMAVMKAGGAFVLLDPSLPLQRRQTMAAQVRATLIITSQIHGPSGAATAPDAQLVVVDLESLVSMADSATTSTELPVVPPESLLYVIFTSGSTGMPKGVMINHTTYTTSALARSTGIGYAHNSRALDFTSYAFDVSIDSMLCTLLRGGCLCIPADQDRVNDLSGVIRRLKVNMANMTPSVARILDPDIIPSLRSLGLGGESCSAGDISIWGQYTRIVVGYGPAECTIGCTVNPDAAGKPYVSIGSGTGAVIWLVDPDDHNKLVPVGAVGELLVEGPIVGQGYLYDPEKTAAAFIDDPAFLLAGGGGVPGRTGRLYKTGDLVRYDPDGERGFVFVGRKDTQIKLRGQRVELGEIEYHVKNLLPPGTDVVAEIISPQAQGKESMIVAFIADREAAKPDEANDSEARHVELSPRVSERVGSLNEELSKVLPIYMIPTAYIGVSKVPMLVSGKTDRKSLRALGATVPLQSSVSLTTRSDADKPTSEAEILLCESWCNLLGLSPDQVGTEHSFFMLGGESVLAMKLVPKLREKGFLLTVADIFNFPTLSDMAKAMKPASEDVLVDMEVPSFSLLKPEWDRAAIFAEAAEQCGIDETLIEDIYPCAPMQEIHVAFYTRSTEGYVAQRVADVPNWASVDKLKAAWDVVFRESSILRTRIVEFKQYGFLQVVINQPTQWQLKTSSLDSFLEEDKNEPMLASTPLCRFTIVHDEALDKLYFVWTAHHAIYDGWSTDLLVEHVEAAFAGVEVSRPAEFKHFIRYLAEPERESSKDYWRAQLEGATGPQFPSLPSRSFIPEPDSLAERFVPIDQSTRSESTIATVIRGAWALVASQYAMSDDVVFGETFTGRTLPIPGVEQIEGPILATIPVRVRFDRTASIREFLQSIQEQGVVRTAHEHLGIQNIRRLSADAQIACEVMMGLVIQPKEPDPPNRSAEDLPSFRTGDAALEALHFNSYPVMLACSLGQDGFRVVASFDSRVISQRQMERVLAQFECAVSQLRGEQTQSLSGITCVSEEELSEIWDTNKAAPLSLQDISSSLSSGDKYPTVRHVPWVAHPANGNLLMPIGTAGELLLEGVGEAADLDAPEWLQRGSGGVPGRQGKLYRTGDLVKYADDLSLVFVGRKETMLSVDGRVINLIATDLELQRLLPTNTEVASHLVLPRGSTSQTPMVVAFIQETPSDEDQMLELGVHRANISFPLSSAVSIPLATAVIGLNKAMLETLPPYAIPSICIPVAQVSDSGEAVDVKSLAAFVEHVTLELVMELRRSFATLRTTIAKTISMTPKERALLSLWSTFLDIEEDKLSLDDNFFRLGGDSIVAMRMVSALRRAGYRLSVADMFQNMKLRSMASAIVESPIEPEKPIKIYSPFSLLDVGDVDAFLSESVRPCLAEPSWNIRDVLPATDPQQRDVKSTVSGTRSSVQYNMLYLDESIDMSKLVGCFRDLVSQHPILRTVFVQHNNQVLQVVLEDIDLPVSESTVEGPTDTYCKELAEADIAIDSAFVFGVPFLHLFVVHGTGEKALMIRISHAQYDGVSLPELLRQLELRYRGLDIPTSAPFTNYIQYAQDAKSENIAYWRNVLRGSSPTEIIAPGNPSSKTAFMTKAVDVTARSPDTTVAALLTAGWATVMGKFLNTSDVTFGGIVSGRDVDMSGVDDMMGPCYQYMPIRVKSEPSWTVTQLLDHVRGQYLEGSQRATLGFDDILRECTEWPAQTTFFGSFVNHLNREYFDDLPFADTKCRVDYIIPHPELPTPPRVVSFLESGKTFVGIEADEDRREFWEARLEELAVTVERFVANPEALL
ncbi:Non-ribosomal peptide synthetase [Neonectria magnoliae]|uniref:Non-ribosomal peptide synthetase n=1 Tax=Neonectria magnoliae TaxID=2732573 RepID=A0ABR1I3Z6_9HYPO